MYLSRNCFQKKRQWINNMFWLTHNVHKGDRNVFNGSKFMRWWNESFLSLYVWSYSSIIVAVVVRSNSVCTDQLLINRNLHQTINSWRLNWYIFNIGNIQLCAFIISLIRICIPNLTCIYRAIDWQNSYKWILICREEQPTIKPTLPSIAPSNFTKWFVKV